MRFVVWRWAAPSWPKAWALTDAWLFYLQKIMVFFGFRGPLQSAKLWLFYKKEGAAHFAVTKFAASPFERRRVFFPP